jgi:hypothetical protein
VSFRLNGKFSTDLAFLRAESGSLAARCIMSLVGVNRL